MHWLEPIFAHTTPGCSTLVLCRTSSTVQYVRGEALKRGGCIGLDILTPLGLALAVHTTAHDDDTELDPDYALVRGQNPGPLPEGHPWAGVNARRGLRDRLLRHTATAHVEQLEPHQLPDSLATIVRSGWGRPEPAHPLLNLLDRAVANRLPADYTYDQVFAIGFGPGAGSGLRESAQTETGPQHKDLPEPPGPQRYHRRLLSALDATRLAARKVGIAAVEPSNDAWAVSRGPGDRADGSIRCVEASDVVAEARWVAACCARAAQNGTAEDDILVLVPGAGDSSRIRAALQRNGVAVANDDHRPLSEHGLGSLLRMLLRMLSVPDPTISGESLRTLFTTRLLALSWPRDAGDLQAATWCFQQGLAGRDTELDVARKALLGDQRKPSLSRRRVHDVLRKCHLRHAPVSVWRAALHRVATEQNPNVYDNVRGAAAHMARLMEWIERVRSERDTIMGLLFEVVAGLGADWRDPVSRGLLNALRAAAPEPLHLDVLEHILAGSTPAARVDRGVRILSASRYDGRPASLLLCTGLHSRGLGAVPGPDPFLDETQLAMLGVYGGERYLDFVFGQVLAAARRSSEVLGCISQRDATGRAVVPVRGLPLTIEPEPVDNYGIGLASPERRSREALQASAQALNASDVAVLCQEGGASEQAAARNATLEWIRAGLTISAEQVLAEQVLAEQVSPEQIEDAEGSEAVHAPLLSHFVEHYRGQIPAALRPWLGDGQSYPASHHSPDRSYSVSRLFRPLTHCLYQAYLSSHIRLRQRDELSEDLDARDVGNAIHDVLEQVGTDPRWRVHADQLQDAQAHLASRLKNETRLQMYPSDGAYTAAVRTAQASLLERWNQHWAGYVAERVVDLDQAEANADRWARSKAMLHPAVGVLADCGDPDRELTTRSQSNLKQWICKAAAEVHHQRDPWDDYVRSIPPKTYKTVWPAISRLRADPATAERLAALAECYGEFLALGLALFGPEHAPARAELGFGDPGEVVLDLSGSHVRVRGRIDRIRSTAHQDVRAVQILDYKTGSAWYASKVDEDYRHGVKPQLLLYAMALEQALEQGEAPEELDPDGAPFILSYDFVQSPGSGYTEHVVGWDMPSLAQFSHLVKTLLAEAREGHYPLIPHPRTCPHLQSWGGGDYCHFQDVCRLR